MFDIIKTALIDFGIYSLFVVIYTLVGAYQNINIWAMKWDWKLWLNGLVKYIVLGAAILGSAVGSYLLLAQANAQGIEITNANAIAPKVILGLVILGSGALLVKIIAKLATKIGVTDEQLKTLQTQAVNQDISKPLVLNLDNIPMPSEDYIAAKLKAEQEGGIGSVYSVPIDSYEIFKATVLGNGYDIDNAYNYQCWDGAALLWQQLGLVLYTGNGLAIGCWDLKRDVNKYDKFELITDVNSLQLGDVVVMRPNHIGFFNGWNGNFMSVLGQNQGGNGNGAPFNIVNIAKSAFAGAFRLNQWHITPAPVPASEPTPIIEPTPTPEVAARFHVGDKVNPTNVIEKTGDVWHYADYNGTIVSEWRRKYYRILELSGDRAVLTAEDSGITWAAMNTANLTEA